MIFGLGCYGSLESLKSKIGMIHSSKIQICEIALWFSLKSFQRKVHLQLHSESEYVVYIHTYLENAALV